MPSSWGSSWGAGAGDAGVLQLNGENLQLNGEDLTLNDNAHACWGDSWGATAVDATAPGDTVVVNVSFTSGHATGSAGHATVHGFGGDYRSRRKPAAKKISREARANGIIVTAHVVLRDGIARGGVYTPVLPALLCLVELLDGVAKGSAVADGQASAPFTICITDGTPSGQDNWLAWDNDLLLVA